MVGFFRPFFFLYALSFLYSSPDLLPPLPSHHCLELSAPDWAPFHLSIQSAALAPPLLKALSFPLHIATPFIND